MTKALAKPKVKATPKPPKAPAKSKGKMVPATKIARGKARASNTSHVDAGDSGDEVEVSEAPAKAPQISWVNDPTRTDRILDWFDANPMDTLKLFSDSTSEAKEEGRSVQTGKSSKTVYHKAIATAVFSVDKDTAIRADFAVHPVRYQKSLASYLGRLKAQYRDFNTQLGKTGAGLDYKDIHEGSPLHNLVQSLMIDFPWWDRFHGHWRKLPSFNPVTVNADSTLDLSSEARERLTGKSQVKDEDGESEDEPAEGQNDEETEAGLEMARGDEDGGEDEEFLNPTDHDQQDPPTDEENPNCSRDVSIGLVNPGDMDEHPGWTAAFNAVASKKTTPDLGTPFRMSKLPKGKAPAASKLAIARTSATPASAHRSTKPTSSKRPRVGMDDFLEAEAQETALVASMTDKRHEREMAKYAIKRLKVQKEQLETKAKADAVHLRIREAELQREREKEAHQLKLMQLQVQLQLQSRGTYSAGMVGGSARAPERTSHGSISPVRRGGEGNARGSSALNFGGLTDPGMAPNQMAEYFASDSFTGDGVFGNLDFPSQSPSGVNIHHNSFYDGSSQRIVPSSPQQYTPNRNHYAF